MLNLIINEQLGRGKYSWLDAHYHFSFAQYYNLDNIHFGVLRVLNDDTISANTGFDTHPHENMEIVTYIIEGELTHIDSMGNTRTLKKGEVQYMSAGTGITHSEYNNSDTPLRLLQIWMLPDVDGHTPNYGDYNFKWEDRYNNWLPIATGSDDNNFPIHIHSDINMYATIVETNKTIDFKVNEGRQAYLVLIDGEANISEYSLRKRDALEIIEEDITIKANQDSHILIIEMAK